MNKSRGFTIVELLIVIVVIGILAAITIVAYNGTQQRAKVMSATVALGQIQKGLRLQAITNSWSAWPDGDDIYPGTPDPTMEFLIANTSLKDFLQTIPKVDNIPTANWTYDNDGDVKPACGGNDWAGVNIEVEGMSLAFATAIDKQTDDGNIHCGTVRYDTGDSTLLYGLAFDQNQL